MFKTRHALLLPGGRFLCPRLYRGECAKQPRDMNRSRPQPRHVRDREQPECSPQSRLIRVREQSAIAVSPRQHAGTQSVDFHDQATVLTVRDLALATGIDTPGPDSVAAKNSPPACVIREFEPAEHCPRHCIPITILPPVHFRVHIRNISVNALI